MADRTRALSVDGLFNARDLGGLDRIDDARTPYGVFFRAESLQTVTPRGWEQLRALGIRTVADLRQPVERQRAGYEPPAWLAVEHVDHDGLADHPEFWGDYWETGLVGTALYYLPHLRQLPHRSAAVLTALARAPEGGVLFHCAGGRDRTGLIAMLLLGIAQAAPDAIVQDYLESVRNGPAVAAAQGRTDGEAASEELCGRHGTTTEGAFRGALAGLEVEPLMGLLDVEDRRAITTWRGSIG